jgi:probable HAF family extracellular repeat protein
MTTYVEDVNDRGDVIGNYQDSEGQWYPYVRIGSQVTHLIPSTGYVQPYAINKSGVVVGVHVFEEGPDTLTRAFRWSNGQFTDLTCFGALQSYAFDINNDGDIVGTCYFGDVQTYTDVQMVWRGGVPHVFLPPQEIASQAIGFWLMTLSDSGVLGILWTDTSFNYHLSLYDHGVTTENYCQDFAPCGVMRLAGEDDFLASGENGYAMRRGGKMQPLTLPGLADVWLSSLNSAGYVSGGYTNATGKQVGLIFAPPVLVDPVPDLVNGDAVTTDVGLLTEHGRIVQGVAADGVARLVLRLPALAAGQSFTVRVLDDSDPPVAATSVALDGGVSAMSGQATPALIATTQSVATNNGNFAFFVYIAPKDFSRSTQDNDLARRVVHLEIAVDGGSPHLTEVEVIRPPVVLVHGLWDNWRTWNTFSPLVLGPNNVDTRFSVGRASYDELVGVFTNSVPWDNLRLNNRFVKANSLGFEHNARSVASQVQNWLGVTRAGANPSGFAVAAAQADIVAHSMGGAIVRTMADMNGFESAGSFGKGPVHKLITINTPHLGSPIARGLGMSENTCVRRVMAFDGRHAFKQVTLQDGRTLYGAIGDLSDDPNNIAISRLAGSTPIAMLTISGVYEAWAALDSSWTAWALRGICHGTPGITNLGASLTGTDWPALFGDEPNDGVVSQNSQQNGSSGSGYLFNGYLHSGGLSKLGFALPSVLDASAVAELVIGLLNATVANFPLVP